jgi:hypothetical protein
MGAMRFSTMDRPSVTISVFVLRLRVTLPRSVISPVIAGAIESTEAYLMLNGTVIRSSISSRSRRRSSRSTRMIPGSVSRIARPWAWRIDSSAMSQGWSTIVAFTVPERSEPGTMLRPANSANVASTSSSGISRNDTVTRVTRAGAAVARAGAATNAGAGAGAATGRTGSTGGGGGARRVPNSGAITGEAGAGSGDGCGDSGDGCGGPAGIAAAIRG